MYSKHVTITHLLPTSQGSSLAYQLMSSLEQTEVVRVAVPTLRGRYRSTCPVTMYKSVEILHHQLPSQQLWCKQPKLEPKVGSGPGHKHRLWQYYPVTEPDSVSAAKPTVLVGKSPISEPVVSSHPDQSHGSWRYHPIPHPARWSYGRSLGK